MTTPRKDQPAALKRKEHEMTKAELLDLLCLLSAIESTMLACKVPIPEGLRDEMDEAVARLRRQILGGNDKERRE